MTLSNYIDPPGGAGTYSVNGVQISGSIYTFSPSASNYTIGYTYTAGIYCNNTGTISVGTNTACCTSSLTQITNTLLTGTNFFSGSHVINNNITISGSTYFENGEFLIAPNVKITVQNGADSLLLGAHLYACKGEMWQGIDVQYDGAVIAAKSNTTGMSTFIEDAITAINVQSITTTPPNNPMPIEITNTIFNKNRVAVSISTVTLNNDLSNVFQENVITCRSLTFSPTSWPTTSTVSPGLRTAVNPTTGLAPPYTLQGAATTTLLPPYAGQVANVGIELRGVSNGINYGIELGESGSTADPYIFNLFDALGICIDATNSNLNIINNVFQNTRQYFVPRQGTKGGSAIKYTVGTNYLYRLSLTNTVSAYGTTPDVGNRFWDCHRAVEASKVYRFNMERATIRSTQSTSAGTVFATGNTGIYLTTNRFQFYVRYNEFTNITYPVNMPIVSSTYDIGGGVVTGIYANNLVVSNNTISPNLSTGTSTTNFVSSAITISSPSAVTWSIVPNTQLWVTDNAIKNVYRGVSVNGMNSYSTAVKGNTISLWDDGLFSATQRGIELVNTLNNVVVTTNTLTGTGTTNTLATLVYLGNNTGSTSPSVTCNSLASSYQAFEFNNANNNTFWRGNLMSTHARGMVISNSGTIGVQGSSGNPSDNQWLGSYTDQTRVDLTSDGQFSKLWVRSGGVWQPTLNAGPFAQNYNTGGYINITTGSFNCGGGSGGGGGEGGRLIGSQSTFTVDLGSIGSNSYAPSASSRIANNNANDLQYLSSFNQYRIIDYDPSLLSITANSSFYNGLSNSSVEKILTAEKLSYLGQYAASKALRSSITPSTNVEENYIKFYDLYEKFTTRFLTEDDLSELVTIASLCPGTNGAVVYQARSLYNAVTQSVFLSNDSCDEEDASSGNRYFSNPAGLNLKWDINLYPNPASDVVSIISKRENDILNVMIRDATGKLVIKTDLKVLNFIANLELRLDDGVYFVTISNAKNETTTKKLVIAK